MKSLFVRVPETVKGFDCASQSAAEPTRLYFDTAKRTIWVSGVAYNGQDSKFLEDLASQLEDLGFGKVKTINGKYPDEDGNIDINECICDINQKATLKTTLQLYRQIGDTNPALKSYTDEFRSAAIGLNEFSKLGLGLFIHWGVYAVPAGNYTGTKQSGSTITATSTNYNTEWIMRDLGIPVDTYKAFGNQFTATNWNPEQLCKQAAEAGIGYVVITAKHHDGFILYPSIYGDWDVTDTPARPTILDELKAACDKYKLKFGLYVSQYWDWTAEGGFGLNVASKKGGYWNGSSKDLYTSAQHTTYMNRTCQQINEMIEKYEPYILWYDPGSDPGSTYSNILKNAELKNWPHVITNDRLTYVRSCGDYGTGERTIYVGNKLSKGEACFTMNNTWGYSDNNESSYYTHEKVMKQFIIYSLAYGQNCLMNIGPKADGSIPSQQTAMLVSIKNFFDKYGSCRDCKRYHYNYIPKFGYIVELANNRLACYIVDKNNSVKQDIVLDCVPTNNLLDVEILTGGADASYEIVNGNIVVHNLTLDSDVKIGVVVLQYSKTVQAIPNKYYASQDIPSRVFTYNSSSLSFDLSSLTYKLRPTSAANHSTEFTWMGDSGNYTLYINRTKLIENPISVDDVLLVTVTDEDSNSQSLSYTYNVNEIEDAIYLEHGKSYNLTFKCSGTVSSELYRLDGFRFDPQVIIIHPESITLNDHEVFVEENGTCLLEYTISPIDVTDDSVVWSSADESIAVVDQDGMVTAIAAGSTNITVSTVDGNKTDSCYIVVTGQSIIHATSITLSDSSISKTIGETHQLTYSILPVDTTYQQVEWSSSNDSIATVSNTGLITATGEGNVIITCKLSYDGIEATCNITVNPVHPESISLNKSSVELIPGFADDIEVTFNPATTTHKDIVWSINDTTVADITNGHVFAKKSGSATITATTVDGGKVAECSIVVGEESYDNIFEADSLTGATDQGTEWDIHIFGDGLTNWTLFGYVKNSKNDPVVEGGSRQTDNNATLYQCVTNASPWSGLRIDADNNNYPTATSDVSSMIPRLLVGSDCYINPITGVGTTSKPKISPTDDIHPVYITRNGNTYKYSIDGVNWNEFINLNSSQIARLSSAILTIGYDYRRASGQITTNKYRYLRTDYPVCVALKTESEYPFYTLNHKYYTN